MAVRLVCLGSALVLASASLLAPNARAANVIRPPRTQSIAIGVVTPGRTAPRLSLTEVQDRLAHGVQGHTGLAARFLDERTLGDCRGSLRCLSDRALRAGEDVRLLLLVTIVAQPRKADEFTATLVAPGVAKRIALDAFDDDRIEDRIATEAVLIRTECSSASTPEALTRILDELFTSVLRSALDPLQTVPPTARIRVEGAPPGAAVVLDGVEIGVVEDDPTLITEVPAGTHEIRLVVAADGSYEETRKVEDGTEWIVRRPALVVSPTERPNVLRYGGIGAAGVGLGLTVWGVIAGVSADPTRCVRTGAEARCDRRGFVTIGEALSSRSAIPDGGGGLRLAPLGYGLVIAGGLVTLGTSDVWPWAKALPWWVKVAVAVGVGATTYVASVLIDG